MIRIPDFFHTSTLVRRRGNRIGALQNEDGVWITDQKCLRDMAVSYFVALFSSQQGTTGEFMQGHFPPLTTAQLAQLQGLSTDEEVTRSLRGMSPLKAPGPDDFQACFFLTDMGDDGS